MADVKEMHYFGRDLHRQRGHAPDEKTYLAQFSCPDAASVIGESSVHYLVSESAAQEIYQFNPCAKILIMIRNPIDQIISNYRQMRFTCQEDQASLHDALALEARRRHEQALPKNLLMTEAILYKNIATYSKQIERYLSVFGREACLVLLTEDLARDPLLVYRKLESFLSLPHFTPVFSKRNEAKAARWHFVNEILYHPPKPLQRLVSCALPIAARRNLVRAIAAGLSQRPKDNLRQDRELRRALAREFEPEVSLLEAMLGLPLKTVWPDFAPAQKNG